MTVSIHANEVRAKDEERAQIEEQVKRFLKGKNKIRKISVKSHRKADYRDFKLPGSPSRKD